MVNETEKMTEEQVILILMNYLEKEGWYIRSFCLGSEHGHDILAEKDEKILIVEAKGAKANNKAKTKKRIFFNNTQIKVHFGKALVQILEKRIKEPHAIYAIAHPDDKGIRNCIGKLIPLLKDININHYWVSVNGNVLEN